MGGKWGLPSSQPTSPGKPQFHLPCRGGHRGRPPLPAPPHRRAESWMQSCPAQRACSHPGRPLPRCRFQYAASAATEHRATGVHSLAMQGVGRGCPEGVGLEGRRGNQRAHLGMCAPAHPQYGRLVLRLFPFPWIPLTDEKMESERRLIPRPPDALGDLNPGLEPGPHLSAPPLSQSYLNTHKHTPSLENEISVAKRENQTKKPVRITQLHHL